MLQGISQNLSNILWPETCLDFSQTNVFAFLCFHIEHPVCMNLKSYRDK